MGSASLQGWGQQAGPGDRGGGSLGYFQVSRVSLVFHLLSFAGVPMLLPSVVEAGPGVPPLVPWSCDGEPMGRLSVGVPRRCLSGVFAVGWGMLGLGLLVLELPIPAWAGEAGAGRAGTKLGMLLPVLDRDAGSGAGTLWRYQ